MAEMCCGGRAGDGSKVASDSTSVTAVSQLGPSVWAQFHVCFLRLLSTQISAAALVPCCDSCGKLLGSFAEWTELLLSLLQPLLWSPQQCHSCTPQVSSSTQLCCHSPALLASGGYWGAHMGHGDACLAGQLPGRTSQQRATSSTSFCCAAALTGTLCW